MALVSPLLLIATVLGFVFLLAGALIAAARKEWPRARRLALTAAGTVAAYFVLLITVSLASHEHIVDQDVPKAFCAADCDLSLSVDSVRKTNGGYVVSVKVQSSAARVTMKPDHPSAILIDEQGREYAPSDDLDPQPFARPVGPGQFYTKTLFFHVPPEVVDPKIFLNEGGWITRISIGDENSFLHRKTLMRIRNVAPSLH